LDVDRSRGTDRRHGGDEEPFFYIKGGIFSPMIPKTPPGEDHVYFKLV
jgi:hypothetical protein